MSKTHSKTSAYYDGLVDCLGSHTLGRTPSLGADGSMDTALGRSWLHVARSQAHMVWAREVSK